MDTTNDLKISFKILGRPPEPQIIQVTANRSVTISLLEYLLPDESCVARQECLLEGESVAVPLSPDSITQLYNAKRPEGSTYENSVNFRVTISAGGKSRTYTFRAVMGALFDGNTVYQRVIGGKDFVSGT